jgi:hypothetical protein
MAKSTTSQPVVSGLTSQSTRGRDYDEEMDARIQVSGKLHRSCVCAADVYIGPKKQACGACHRMHRLHGPRQSHVHVTRTFQPSLVQQVHG